MPASSRAIRTANRYRLLRHLIAESPVSRPRLAAASGLSLASVANVTGELLGLGMLAEAGYEDSDGGRPRVLLEVSAGAGALIGVDVAETYVHAELFDLTLTSLARADAELSPGTAGDNTPDRVVREINGAVGAVVEEAGIAPGTVLGVGLSMPGQVEREGGVSVYAANWDWREVPLLALLGEHLPYPLYLDNPLRACTVAELWFGAARGLDDTVVVNLGTGVGAGLALGGSLHRGASNSAGEWGHTTLVLDGRPCHCGRTGCVEAYVGAPGIMRSLTELAPDSPLLHPGDQSATVDALARGVAGHDPLALRVLRETARYLGAAIGDLINLLNPQAVVLSSWVAARLGQPLLEEVRRAVDRYALPRPLAATEIVLSPVPSNPVSLGAAAFALEGSLASITRTATKGER